MAELSLEEVFTVRPNAVPNRRIDLGAQESSSDLTSHPPSGIALSKPVTPPVPPGLQLRSPSSISIEVEAESQQRIEGPSASAFAPGGNDSSSIQIQETVLRNAPPFEETAAVLPIPAEERPPAPPVLHPLQTAFSPVPPTSPPYGSPYGYPPTLPPGVAMGRNGMPYELATGRPVYLQATPPRLRRPCSLLAR
ncbi:hypothetical protein A0H81_09624 [Grifola frondosa]|uniref:Uncharacterized protein n=1 Tax=Grifola frondosa TaxID=5627 RepID=A0A1C7M148_GRIFR|nr:hypothetical protein A0H81_09624 [Grifola frondosa]